MNNLTKLRDEHGRETFLDARTGEVFDASGKRITRMVRDHETEEALGLFAAVSAHQTIANQTGRKVTLRTMNEGKLVTMDLSPSDVHIDSGLPNFAQGYTLAEGIADAVCPVVPTPKQSDKYFTWSSANAFERVLPNIASPGAQPNEVNPTLSNTSFSTVPYALQAFVPTEVGANADAPLAPERAALSRLMNALRLEREIRVSNLLSTSANWATGQTITVASGFQWNGGASSDPIKDLQTAIENSYLPVTGIVWSERLRHNFVRNPAVQKYITYKDGTAPLPNDASIAGMLELPRIYTGRMKYTTGGAPAYVWGNNVILLHQPAQNPPTSQEEAATAYTFRWNGAGAPDGTYQGGFLVRAYFDERRGARGGRTVVLTHNDAEIMTSNIIGGILVNAYQ